MQTLASVLLASIQLYCPDLAQYLAKKKNLITEKTLYITKDIYLYTNCILNVN